ncbi:hypothetical protein [Enterococcus sp. 12E11_DIV0728]|uniref:hypothetical protein n=1 Tax=Enterococcus sp. 12E11_DIV0728 TaxID=1834168 RepID=UPI000A347029|nr:hypothetical protein [Enterococcus sp. 12E11_DIV0728]OTO67567.1 hypothetical protein A5865_003246 [Enterococcus sp. 12E11_DIV0728]
MCIRDRYKIGIDSGGTHITAQAYTSNKELIAETTAGPVSYTHLDVYKRQDSGGTHITAQAYTSNKELIAETTAGPLILSLIHI